MTIFNNARCPSPKFCNNNYYYHLLIGKLPVEINNNSVPQHPNIVSMAIEELPPPIPPKNVGLKEIGTPLTRPDDDVRCEKQRQFQATQEPTSPALPPKPKNY